MKPISFNQQNHVLGKPYNMTDDQCAPLPVFMGEDAAGFPVVVSKWELSETDLARVKETGHIYLVVIGATHPPLSIHAESPFEE